MTVLRNASPSVVDFGGVMNSPNAVAWKGGKLQAAFTPLQRLMSVVRGATPPQVNAATRDAFQTALEGYLGRDDAQCALQRGGANPDGSQPLLGEEIRRVLDAAHHLKRLHAQIQSLKKIHVESVIARNAEDCKIVEAVLDRGGSLADMELSRPAQAKVDAAQRNLDAKWQELRLFLQG